jgi:hypothetical protein
MSTVILGAQTEKGNFLVGGRGTIGITSEVFSAFVSPDVYYFVKDDLAIGGFLSLGTVRVNGFGTTDFGVGPAIRYYLPIQLKEQIKPFAGAQLTYLLSRQNSNINNFDLDYNTFNWILEGGLAIFLNPSVAIEPIVAFRYTNSQSDLFLEDGSSFNFEIGFQIYLNGNKE